MKKAYGALILMVVIMAACTAYAVDAAGSGKCVFDHSVTATVEPIIVSYTVSNLQLKPGEEITMTYTISNLSPQKHYGVFCDIEVPQNCLVGAKWADSGEYYAPGTEFEVPSQCYRKLILTVSPNLDFEGEIQINIKFFRTYSVEGKG